MEPDAGLSRWALAIILFIGAHFSASYLVPLDEAAQKTFLGLLRWAWPWAYGDHGPLGRLSQEPSGFPIAGFFLAVTSGGLLLLSAFAVAHWWIPLGWWRSLGVAGALLQVVLMMLFLGPTKLIPILLDAFVLYTIFKRSP